VACDQQCQRAGRPDVATCAETATALAANLCSAGTSAVDSAAALSGWRVSWSTQGSVTQVWNGVLAGSVSPVTTVSNAPYNGTLVILRGGDQTIMHPADLMPTSAHFGLRYNMAYDLMPYENMINKGRLLEEMPAM
jgi:hypothetical protein